MNRAHFLLFVRALGICCLAIGISAGTKVTANEPLEVKLSLAKTRIVQGEPVVLSYSLTNNSTAPQPLDLGKDRVGWLTISIADDRVQKRSQPKDVSLLFYPTGGTQRTTEIDLYPERTLKEQIVLTRFYS